MQGVKQNNGGYIMKTRLNKREVELLLSLRDRIDSLRDRIDPEDEIMLQVEGNGTIGGQLSCASASIDTILQEYL